MALENASDEPLPDEEAAIEERTDLLDDKENLVDVDEFLDER